MSRSFSMTNDLDSPTVRSEPPAERKVPSCPQKSQKSQGSGYGKRQGMPPPVFYAVPRTAANAALHPDVSYVTGSEPGNAEGKVVKYRALS